MSIIIKGINVPQDCTNCACTNYFGGCLLVAKLKPDVSIEEYDDEWHKAHKEHRRMKYCPIVDPTTYEQAMIEEILSEKEATPYIVRFDLETGKVDKNSYTCPICHAEYSERLTNCVKCGVRFNWDNYKSAVKDFEDNYGSQQD